MEFRKKALLVIDMQKDILRGRVKTGMAILPSIQKVLQACRKNGIETFYLLRQHRSDGTDVERFRLESFKKSPFTIKGSEGAEVIDELKPLPNEYLISKKRFSGFFQTDLLMLLTRLQIKELVIVGVQTPNCIRATATDAIAYDYDVTLLEDAIAAQSLEVHQANLFDMRNMGINVQKVEEFLENL